MPRVTKGAARTQARKRILRSARGYFGVNQSLDRTVRECAAGVDVLTGSNVTLRLGYSGQFTASGTTHGATLKFTRSF